MRCRTTGIADTLSTLDDLRGHGVEVVSVADGFDLSGQNAEIIIAVMAWAAKMERLAVNERIASARDRLADEGRPWGRPRRMSDELVARARAMHAKGRTVREIAIALKKLRPGVPRRLLRVHAKSFVFPTRTSLHDGYFSPRASAVARILCALHCVENAHRFL